MDVVTAVVIISTTWSVLGGGYLYLLKWSMMSSEIETLKEQGRQYRQNTKPKEWWQEVAIELAKNPDALDKILALKDSPGIVQMISNLKR